jgi:hypothetical protein
VAFDGSERHVLYRLYPDRLGRLDAGQASALRIVLYGHRSARGHSAQQRPEKDTIARIGQISPARRRASARARWWQEGSPVAAEIRRVTVDFRPQKSVP